MWSLSQPRRLDGLLRISPVAFPASYFTFTLHPVNATALGSYPLSMENGSTGVASVPPFCLCASRRTRLTGSFQGQLFHPRGAPLALRPKGSPPAGTGDGVFHTFHHHASGRTATAVSLLLRYSSHQQHDRRKGSSPQRRRKPLHALSPLYVSFASPLSCRVRHRTSIESPRSWRGAYCTMMTPSVIA